MRDCANITPPRFAIDKDCPFAGPGRFQKVGAGSTAILPLAEKIRADPFGCFA